MLLRGRSIGELKWLICFRSHQLSKTLWQESVQRVLASDASGSDLWSVRLSDKLGRPVAIPKSRRHKFDKNPGWGGRTLTVRQQREVFRGVMGDGSFNPRNWPHVRVCSGIWNSWELRQMVQFLELRALRKVQAAFSDELRNTAFLAWQDNTVVERVTRKKYSRSPLLHRELGLYLDEQAALNARGYCKYIRSRFNPSDIRSRPDFTSDWHFSARVLRRIWAAFGTPTVDRFAEPHNYVVPRWNCPYEYPGVEGVDCRTQVWGGELNWCNPP